MGRSNGRCNGGVGEDGFGEDGGVGVSEDGSSGSDIKRSGFPRGGRGITWFLYAAKPSGFRGFVAVQHRPMHHAGSPAIPVAVRY